MLFLTPYNEIMMTNNINIMLDKFPMDQIGAYTLKRLPNMIINKQNCQNGNQEINR